MTYPPPNADLYAINGYKFFRLNTKLISDGDIYESAQGAQGFAIGPDSDISKVNIAYFDDQLEGNFMNQVAISPERPFPGLIAARNDAKYMPAGRPGKTLIWPDELYNPTWDPDFIDIAGRVDFEVPVLDVVQYFSPSGLAMTGGRNDKEYWYDFINAPAAGVGVTNAWVVVIPFYGRRFASIMINNGQAQDVTLTYLGLNYKPGSNNTAAANKTLYTGNVNTGVTDVRVLKASTLGMWDALALEFSGNTQIDRTIQSTIRIRVSDRED